MTRLDRTLWLGTAGVLVLALGGCSSGQEEAEPLIRSVRYVVVTPTVDDRERTFSGALEASSESKLSFQVSGKIQKLPVKTGQRVKKGQLIAELDPADFELQLREARSAAAQARARSKNAEANYLRVRRLYETRNTSRQDLDAARTERDTSKSAYIGAVDTVSRLKRQLSYTRLAAPADGTVNSVTAEVNEVVAAGAPIAVVQSGDELQASVDVPEAFVRLIRLGNTARVRIGALEKECEGSVSEIGVAAAGTGVFPVMVSLASEPEGARPGMVAEVVLKPQVGSEPAPDGFQLPLTAIGEDRQGRYVFRIDGDPGAVGTVQRQEVETGKLTATGIYVTSGVEEGQRVVVAGVSRIQNGLQVRIPAEPAREGDSF